MKEYKVVEMGGYRPEIEAMLNSYAILGWEMRGVYHPFAILEREAGAEAKTEASAPPPEVVVATPAPVAAATPRPQVVVSKPVFPGRRK